MMNTPKNVVTWDKEESRPAHPLVPHSPGTAAGATEFKSAASPSVTTTTLSQSVLVNWSGIIESGITPRLFARIVRIAMQPAGWRGMNSRPLRAESLRLFLAFWSAIRNEAIEPELALTADGSLQAEWFRSDRQRLDISFVEPRLIFGLFASNSILEGAESLTTVAALLKGHPAKPLRWKSQ